MKEGPKGPLYKGDLTMDIMTPTADNIAFLEAIYRPVANVKAGLTTWHPGTGQMERISSIEGPEFHGGKVRVLFARGGDVFLNTTDYIPLR